MANNRTALITGITGQDGFYLARHLLVEGYQVIGIVRRTSTPTDSRINSLRPSPCLHLEDGDVTDASSLTEIVGDYKPDHFYHLAAQSITADALCPIKSAQKVEYRTLADLWDCQIAKNKAVRTEKFGPTEVEVIDLPENTQLKAMGMWNGMGTWFPIKQISRHRWTGPIAKMSQKFGSIKVTPNHSILDVNQQLAQPHENPWLLNVRKFNTAGVSSIEDFPEKHHSDLAYFVGAFISEGHTTFNEANGSYLVCISNGDKSWLGRLGDIATNLFNVKVCYVPHKKDEYNDVWRLEFSNKEIYSLLRKWCGDSSLNKKLPYWFAEANYNIQREMFDALIKGDGSYVEEHDSYRYTTASYELACHISWLLTSLGFDYTVNEEPLSDTHSAWHFRTCKSYQPNQGSDARKLEWIDYDGWVYDITVDEVHNFVTGVGNIVVHNSHVGKSWKYPIATAEITGMGTLNCLEAIRKANKETRFYFAGSSEMFGNATDGSFMLDEDSPMKPESPYATSKLFGYHMTRTYRRSYGMHASNGILFNHESPLRGQEFVTRKITMALARIKHGLQEHVELGNIDAKRDWGHARDYCRAIHSMLIQDVPDDYVVATGKAYSVRQFLEECCDYFGLDPDKVVKINQDLIRPKDVKVLVGDARKARKRLQWSPVTDFAALAKEMCEYDQVYCHPDPAMRALADQFV